MCRYRPPVHDCSRFSVLWHLVPAASPRPATQVTGLGEAASSPLGALLWLAARRADARCPRGSSAGAVRCSAAPRICRVRSASVAVAGPPARARHDPGYSTGPLPAPSAGGGRHGAGGSGGSRRGATHGLRALTRAAPGAGTGAIREHGRFGKQVLPLVRGGGVTGVRPVTMG